MTYDKEIAITAFILGLFVGAVVTQLAIVFL